MLSRVEDTIQTIPSQPGSYLLWLNLPCTQDLKVGKLGTLTFPSGDYVYLGSAYGPGGLRARLGRHLRGDGRLHWHIDYLRTAASIRGFGYIINRRGAVYCAPTECNWSQKVAALSKAKIVAPGFGASDCQSGCVAHLVHISTYDIDQIFQLLNCEIRILRAD